MMKILIVGLGAIGLRHAQNARTLADTAIMDSNAERLHSVSRDLDLLSFTDLHAALDWKPDGVIIATPHHHHLSQALLALNNGAHVLIEKPIAARSDGVEDVLSLAREKDLRVHVACNMRYHPGVVTVREHLPQIGRVLLARAWFGSYLPAMRPNADYRELYCAKRDQGGGAILDGIHELDYLEWMLGEVEDISATIDRVSNLEIDVEDTCEVQMWHRSNVRSTVHFDYLQQAKRRGLEVVGETGTLLWESEGKTPEHCKVRIGRSDQSWETLLDADIDQNKAFTAMMSDFVSVLHGQEAPGLLDGNQALQSLRLCEQAYANATGKLAVSS